jgi:uncharacterized protein YdcH (DUF465 family)
MQNDAEIKKILKTQNREFNKLVEQHSEYEKRLNHLEKRAYLNQNENMEVKKLKKQKLMIKDKMEAMIRNYRKSFEGNPS